jgi:hypothetical protein
MMDGSFDRPIKSRWNRDGKNRGNEYYLLVESLERRGKNNSSGACLLEKSAMLLSEDCDDFLDAEID